MYVFVVAGETAHKLVYLSAEQANNIAKDHGVCVFVWRECACVSIRAVRPLMDAGVSTFAQ